MMAKIRPQIMSLVLTFAALAGYALYIGAAEVASAIVAGVIAVSMKMLEDE